MTILDLLWNVNVSDKTKYLFLIGLIVCSFILCFLSGKKKKSKKKQTKCQKNYSKCIRNNIKNKTNDFCFPCLEDGSAPDFFYNHNTGQWIKSS